MIDHAVLVTELRGRIAAKPNWGRQELLVLMAELEVEHTVPEDELDRALRLTMPAALDLLFNRMPSFFGHLESESGPASGGGDSIADRDASVAHSTMAVR